MRLTLTETSIVTTEVEFSKYMSDPSQAKVYGVWDREGLRAVFAGRKSAYYWANSHRQVADAAGTVWNGPYTVNELDIG